MGITALLGKAALVSSLLWVGSVGKEAGPQFIQVGFDRPLRSAETYAWDSRVLDMGPIAQSLSFREFCACLVQRNACHAQRNGLFTLPNRPKPIQGECAEKRPGLAEPVKADTRGMRSDRSPTGLGRCKR